MLELGYFFWLFLKSCIAVFCFTSCLSSGSAAAPAQRPFPERFCGSSSRGGARPEPDSVRVEGWLLASLRVSLCPSWLRVSEESPEHGTAAGGCRRCGARGARPPKLPAGVRGLRPRLELLKGYCSSFTCIVLLVMYVGSS